MQNFPECSPGRLPDPATVRLPSKAPVAHRDRAMRHAGHSTYAIRVLRSPGVPCATCGAETGMGAVGHDGDDPVCDRCLLEQCEPLGMLLALVAVTRAYATTGTNEPDAARESLVELGGFARIFEHVIAKWGPPRLVTPRNDRDDG